MAQIGENSYSPQIPEDPPKPEAIKKKPVEIRISVFFDGTGNNRGNIRERKSRSGLYRKIKAQNPGEGGKSSYASFEADFSNIALLEEQYQSTTECTIFQSFYIEGAGTRDLKTVNQNYETQAKARAEARKQNPRNRSRIKIETDSALGNGAAIQSTGLYAKIDRAYNDIMFWYQDLLQKKRFQPLEHEITNFVVDVFGFSRGAATARSFIHHLLYGTRQVIAIGGSYSVFTPGVTIQTVQKNTLKQGLERFSITVANNAIEIGFAGLFDTVSSYILALTSDVKLLHLDAISRARKVYHLAAAEEHRLCFSLTNIHSAGGKGEEYFLPGVHSDIGGGYLGEDQSGEMEVENFDLMNNKATTLAIYNMINRGGIVMDYEAFRQLLLDEGWYTRGQIHHNKIDGWVWDDIALKVERLVGTNAYRRIPLHLMAEAMARADFTFKARLQSHYKIPTELSEVESKIRKYIAGTHDSKPEDWFKKKNVDVGFDIKTLRNRYLHYSARVDRGHWPRFKQQQRFRQTYDG